MSEIVASYAFTSRLIDRALAVKGRMDTLSTQAATGRVGETFGDLGVQARVSADLRAEIARRDSYGRLIQAADGRIGATQDVLARMGDLSKELSAKALAMITTGANSVGAVAEQARQALAEMGSLLNTRAGGAFLFAGTDAARAPVPIGQDILLSPFFLQIEAQVNGLAVGNAAAVLSGTLATAASDDPLTTPFSPFLSTPMPLGGLDEPRLAVPDADGSRIAYGLRANANGAAISPDDPPTTGSFVRDMLRGFAVLAALDTASTQVRPDFQQVVTGIATSLDAAVRTLDQERAALGVAQQRLAAAGEQHATLITTLTRQVSGIEDVPMEETLSRLQQVRTQLESNYQLIAAIRDFTLARFL